MLLIAVSMFYTRQQVVRVHQSPLAQQQWDEWRRAMSDQQAQPGPVLRRPVRSAEPPALVLMRDYFGVCLAMTLVLSGVLIAVLLMFLRGIW